MLVIGVNAMALGFQSICIHNPPVIVAHGYLALIRPLHPHDTFNQGGLAGSVLAYQRTDLAFFYLEADII